MGGQLRHMQSRLYSSLMKKNHFSMIRYWARIFFVHLIKQRLKISIVAVNKDNINCDHSLRKISSLSQFIDSNRICIHNTYCWHLQPQYLTFYLTVVKSPYIYIYKDPKYNVPNAQVWCATQTPKSATLIDNIFANKYENGHRYMTGILTTDISDHYPIFHISLNQNKLKEEEYQMIRLINGSNLEKIHKWYSESWLVTCKPPWFMPICFYILCGNTERYLS